jgi:hypothetical protein
MAIRISMCAIRGSLRTTGVPSTLMSRAFGSGSAPDSSSADKSNSKDKDHSRTNEHTHTDPQQTNKTSTQEHTSQQRTSTDPTQTPPTTPPSLSFSSLESAYTSIRDVLRHHNTQLLGAEKLESVKETIGELQDTIMHDKDKLMQATTRKHDLEFKLSECESSLDHIKKFRRLPNNDNNGKDNKNDKQLEGEEFIKSVNALNSEHHRVQQLLQEATHRVDTLTNTVTKMQLTLDKQLAIRYQEELLVLERSRTFSAVATLASFVTTVLLLASRTLQTNTYESAIETAQTEIHKQQHLFAEETERGKQRDGLLKELHQQMQELKVSADTQQELVKAMLAQQDLLKLLTIASSGGSSIDFSAYATDNNESSGATAAITNRFVVFSLYDEVSLVALVADSLIVWSIGVMRTRHRTGTRQGWQCRPSRSDWWCVFPYSDRAKKGAYYRYEGIIVCIVQQINKRLTNKSIN